MEKPIESLSPPRANLSVKQRRVLKKARAWAEQFFIKAEEQGLVSGGHGFDHNKRTAGMAATLSVLEGHDPFLPVLAALVFDLGRTSNDPRAANWHHGEISREFSNDFLDSLPLLTEQDRVLVKNAIEDHPKLNSNVRRSYVVEIIMDADRLDTLGALGPVRAAAHRWHLPLYATQIETSSVEGEIKTIYQDFAYRGMEFYDMLWTKSARKIAKPRYKFLKKFVQEFKKEASFMHQAFNNLKI